MFDFGRNDEIVPDRDDLPCYHAMKRRDCMFHQWGKCECSDEAISLMPALHRMTWRERHPALWVYVKAALLVLALMLIGGLLDG